MSPLRDNWLQSVLCFNHILTDIGVRNKRYQDWLFSFVIQPT